ncbi:hypothetical protein [Zobellia galactanivorans]|uniref:hypothetical protein n=1 Tax=Zobellia galactanivorans (strain DSM 12802 / CCUG 47099 / CIP 106680 / NCIMB 13871 / Dsij) TaxID=63186 RepID=UPI001C06ECDB|nr:hypothetical protein [Zobellia galactanivorans]MBU3024070.1 hypothetical protein [Zobellia galactanivorans]
MKNELLRFYFSIRLLYLVLLLSGILINCGNRNNLIVKNEKKSFKIMNEEKKDYMLNYRFGSAPYEILINDMVCSIDLESGMPGPIDLNEFLVNSSQQKIKIKISHPFVHKGGLLKKNDIYFFNKDLIINNVYFDENENMQLDSISKLSFPDIETPVPYIENEWTFNASLPFSLTGWKDSKDLRAFDKEELEQMVVLKFEELWKMLNDGDNAGFMTQLKFRNKEFYLSNYFNDEQVAEYETNLSNTYLKHKNNMIPMDNYRMRILGDGKAVSLERLGKHKGQGVLLAEDEQEKVLYLNYVTLHIPEGKEKLEIVRINPLITSLE